MRGQGKSTIPLNSPGSPSRGWKGYGAIFPPSNPWQGWGLLAEVNRVSRIRGGGRLALLGEGQVGQCPPLTV